jgi:hypothetical protein
MVETFRIIKYLGKKKFNTLKLDALEWLKIEDLKWN